MPSFFSPKGSYYITNFLNTFKKKTFHDSIHDKIIERTVGFVLKDVVMNASSKELIDMLADRGFCQHWEGDDDKRKAYIAAVETFTNTGKTCVKIVVSVNDEFTYDFGVRLFMK